LQLNLNSKICTFCGNKLSRFVEINTFCGKNLCGTHVGMTILEHLLTTYFTNNIALVLNNFLIKHTISYKLSENNFVVSKNNTFFARLNELLP